MTLKYFTDANSAMGYVNRQAENLTGITKTIYLKSPEDYLVSRLLEDLLPHLLEQKLQPELIYSTFNPEYLSGIVIRERGIAIVSSGEKMPPDAVMFELKDLYHMETIKKNQSKIDAFRLKMRESYKKMAMHFNAALLIHDEWEKIYVDRMDFDKAKSFGEHFVVSLFENVPNKTKEAQIKGRFFGTSTPVGLMDFIPELTSGLKRFLIKGRPGSGKSTLMRRVLTKAIELGYDADIYYCSLDPKSLDMVVIPELNFCIFDATAPHEYDPIFDTDEIIDTYAEFIKSGTDERWQVVIRAIESKYHNQIRQARVAMKTGHDARLKLSKLYNDSLMLGLYNDVLVTLIENLPK